MTDEEIIDSLEEIQNNLDLYSVVIIDNDISNLIHKIKRKQYHPDKYYSNGFEKPDWNKLSFPDRVDKITSWEPRWQSPTARTRCPSCGTIKARRFTWWSANINGYIKGNLRCEESNCSRNFIVKLPYNVKEERNV